MGLITISQFWAKKMKSPNTPMMWWVPCENSDKFAIDRKLPKIDKGDILVIHDAGAHGFSMGYNYNGKLRSAEVLLKADGSFKLIRRAETPKDYFATINFYPEFKDYR